MKDKIVFFVIGAVLSALAFFAGSQQNKKPDALPSELNVQTIQCKELRVEDFIQVGREGGAWVIISAGSKGNEELGLPATPNTAHIDIYSGFSDESSRVGLGASEGGAGIYLDTPIHKSSKQNSVSIHALKYSAILNLKSGDKEKEIEVMKYSD